MAQTNHQKLDLLELSDKFRRASGPANKHQAFELVQLTKKLGGELTWYYPEYRDKSELNARAAKNIAQTIHEIARRAKQQGFNSVTLPLTTEMDGYKNLTAGWLKRAVLDKENFDVPVMLAPAPYDVDLSGEGPINLDHTELTILDENIVGVTDRSDRVRTQWSDETHIRNQGQFNF